ncbi:MAG TPA: 4a-hydroxytetrahydrobiopterin dehydratase [Actinomycetota bacterium]
MPKAPLLDESEIGRRLDALPAWERKGDQLVRTVRFADFTEAVAFVSRLVEPSNGQNHHPDVAIHWNEVTLTLWTHASGGLTERDFRLAATIDALAPDAGT